MDFSGCDFLLCSFARYILGSIMIIPGRDNTYAMFCFPCGDFVGSKLIQYLGRYLPKKMHYDG